jgi:hypothetical protein
VKPCRKEEAPATDRAFPHSIFHFTGTRETHRTSFDGKIPFFMCELEDRGLDNFRGVYRDCFQTLSCRTGPLHVERHFVACVPVWAG